MFGKQRGGKNEAKQMSDLEYSSLCYNTTKRIYKNQQQDHNQYNKLFS